MTKQEEKFYKTFEIKRKTVHVCNLPEDTDCPNLYCCNHYCEYEGSRETDYPPITDHILLELLCILAKSDFYGYYSFSSKNITELKERILNDCIKRESSVKTHIRKLFEE